MPAGDLTTLAAVETYLGLPAGNSDEPKLSALITACSTAFASYCGRQFASAAFTDVRNGTGSTSLWLKQSPITAVSSVIVDGDSIPAGGGWANGVRQPGYSFDDNYIYLFGHRFCKGQQNVQVVYTAGYAAIPADLAQACNEQVAFRYKETKDLGKRSITGPAQGQSTNFVIADFMPNTRRVLDLYRRVVPGWP